MPAMAHPLETPPPHRHPGTARTAARGTAAVLAAALGVAASSGVSPPAGAAAGATVQLSTSATFGTILTNGAGFALYKFASDVNGKSSCSGSCAAVWPALTVAAGVTPTTGSGVPGMVGESLQGNGTYQVTYNGAPLYTFVSDTAPGQVSGNNVAGFTVIVVTASTPTTTTTPAAPTTTAVSSPMPTPTTTPRSTPAPTTASTGASVPAPAAGTATAAASSAPSASGSSGSSPAAASTPGTTGTPGTLAVTGPGTGLVVVGIVGTGLIVFSASMLVAVGDRRRLRQGLRRASRTGWWLRGR